MAEILLKSAREDSLVDPRKVDHILGVSDTETETPVTLRKSRTTKPKRYTSKLKNSNIVLLLFCNVSMIHKCLKKINFLTNELNRNYKCLMGPMEDFLNGAELSLKFMN